MNPFPGKNSVIIMDNARIHHDETLVESVEEVGGKVVYLPPYSPDFNPIEYSFSVIKHVLKALEREHSNITFRVQKVFKNLQIKY